ncbi:MAG: hypothetical protein HFJ80_04315 [Clostridiales bacterium]|nr:hypothetical protein [Clostridiales bacterium]
MMSQYGERAVLNALRGTPFRAEQLYLGLFVSPPTSVTAGKEPDDPRYTRLRMELTEPRQEGSAAIAVNAQDCTFAAAFTHWGPATHFGLFDAVKGGHLLLYGELEQPLNIHKWEAPAIPAGSLKVTAR